MQPVNVSGGGNAFRHGFQLQAMLSDCHHVVLVRLAVGKRGGASSIGQATSGKGLAGQQLRALPQLERRCDERNQTSFWIPRGRVLWQRVVGSSSGSLNIPAPSGKQQLGVQPFGW